MSINNQDGQFISCHNVHSSWIERPEFQLLVHQVTGEKTGRIYAPTSYINNYRARFERWLSSNHIQFDESDLKFYDDGSVRIYFKSTDAEYERCAKYFPKQNNKIAA